MGSLNPTTIRFSQSSVNGSQEIIESMAKNGWIGDTIYNTRVVAARAAGIDVQATVHNGNVNV